MSPKHWLMKAEPDSRIVKGKDVKFSVDDFESVKTTSWEGVRNAEARNLMKEMAIGDKVSKQAYPDYTAWDPSHPYFDPKTDKDKPKWHMVDVTFVSRTPHFIPLALLRTIAAASEDDVPEEVTYIGADGVKAIKQMALVTRGRLSVQRVEEQTWAVIQQLAEKGGWVSDASGSSKAKLKAAATPKKGRKTKGTTRKGKNAISDDQDKEPDDDSGQQGEEDELVATKVSGRHRKRKAEELQDEPAERIGTRRSTRARK